MKLTHILGLPVVHAHTGKILGEITGWLIDAEKKQLACLLAKSDLWYQGVCGIEFSRIVGMGRGAVLVTSELALHPLALDRKLRTMADERIAIVDAPVFLPDGEPAGIVEDLIVDDRGQIRNLILRGGEVVEQRRLLVFGQCVLIARAETKHPAQTVQLPPIVPSQTLKIPKDIL